MTDPRTTRAQAIETSELFSDDSIIEALAADYLAALDELERVYALLSNAHGYLQNTYSDEAKVKADILAALTARDEAEAR